MIRTGILTLFLALVSVVLIGHSAPSMAQTKPDDKKRLEGEEPQTVERRKFGDWRLRCGTPVGAKTEQCGLVQHIDAEDVQGLKLSIFVIRIADKKDILLRVLAPLGVLLPFGLTIYVDGDNLGRAGFSYCSPDGCLVEAILNDNLIEKFKSGKEATFAIHRVKEVGIGVPISLNGFAEALSNLK